MSISDNRIFRKKAYVSHETETKKRKEIEEEIQWLLFSFFVSVKSKEPTHSEDGNRINGIL